MTKGPAGVTGGAPILTPVPLVRQRGIQSEVSRGQCAPSTVFEPRGMRTASTIAWM